MKTAGPVVFLFVLIISSCTKPPLSPMGCEFPDGDVIYYADLDTPEYYFPSFNPANPNEICYAKQELLGGAPTYSLRKYNLQTQSGDTIRQWNNNSNYLSQTLKWGAGGYIITSQDYENIYRIDPVTGEIVYLSIFMPSLYWPIWSYDGTKILYTNGNTGGHNRIELMDINGNVLDSVHHDYYQSYIGYATSLSNGHYLTYFYDLNIYEFDENLDSVAHYSINQNWTPCVDFNVNCYQIRDIDNVGTSYKIVFSTPLAMYSTDFSTGITTVISTTCETNPYYGDFTVSPDGQKIIYTKIHLQKVGAIDYRIHKKIHMMNIDGTGDQILQLP